MILFELDGAVTVAPPATPPLGVDLQLASDPPTGLAIDFTLDLTPAAEASPTSLQRVGWVVRVDGVEVPGHLLGAISVSESLDNLLLAWTIEAPAPCPPFGARPDKRRVDIFGAYLTSTGLHLVPKVTGGIVDNVNRSRDAAGRAVSRYEGVSSGGRYDGRIVEYSRPPGHGLNRSAVIGELASNAGWSLRSLAPGGRMDKEIVVGKEDSWAAVALDLAATDGRTLLEDPYGNLENPVDGYDPNRPVDLVLKLVQLTGTQTAAANGDVVTRVTVTGTQQITRPGTTRRVEIQTVISKSVYAYQVAASAQNSDGSLSSTGLSTPAATLQVTGKVITVRELDGDTLVSEQVFTYSPYNPLAARYALHADGTVDKVAGVFLYAGAAPGDDAMAYRWQQEQLALTGYAETIPRYDERGLLVESVTRKDEPFLRRAAVMARPDTSTPWTDPDLWIAGRLVLGNRSGVISYSESMPYAVPGNQYLGLGAGQEKVREVTTYTNTDDGYVQSQRLETWEYFAPAGSLWQFAGEEGRSQEAETFGLHEVEETFYVASAADNSHSVVRILAREGQVVESEVTDGQEGHGPAAERRLDIVPPADSFATPEEFAAAVAASRFETAEIGAEEIDWTLEATHERRDETVSAEWAETPEECRILARRLLRESSAWTVELQLAGANFYLRPAMRVRTPAVADLVDDALSPDALVDVYLRDVDTSGDEPILSNLRGRYYPA